MRMVVESSAFDTGLVFMRISFDVASMSLWSKWLDSTTVVVGTDSMTVVGTRFLPSRWCWWWLLLCCTKLPLRFERVDAADALLLLRDPRREPDNIELDFKSVLYNCCLLWRCNGLLQCSTINQSFNTKTKKVKPKFKYRVNICICFYFWFERYKINALVEMGNSIAPTYQ